MEWLCCCLEGCFAHKRSGLAGLLAIVCIDLSGILAHELFVFPCIIIYSIIYPKNLLIVLSFFLSQLIARIFSSHLLCYAKDVYSNPISLLKVMEFACYKCKGPISMEFKFY